LRTAHKQTNKRSSVQFLAQVYTLQLSSEWY